MTTLENGVPFRWALVGQTQIRRMIVVMAITCLVCTKTMGQDSQGQGQTEHALTPYQSGVVYKEFSHHADKETWRVTDEKATVKFPQRAAEFLPNPIRVIDGVDLRNAIAAEIVLDRWGGHRGTINKRIRFNSNEWITIPEIQGTPKGIRPEMLMFQDNPTVPVPLDHLLDGKNQFEGACDEAGGFGWGQWGMYSVTLRVYYDVDALNSKIGFQTEIVSPRSGQVLSENPTIDVRASSVRGVVRVEVLAHFDGYDEDGDGDHGGWHESRFQLSRGAPNDVRNHVGTRWRQPYRFLWNTYYVPDQAPKSIQILARVQDLAGYWTVTEPITDLTLQRSNSRVKIFQAQNVPEDFAVRVGETKQCTIEITDTPKDWTITSAALHLRTWHGDDESHEPILINETPLSPGGKNHHYDYDLIEFQPSALVSGTNVFAIHSETEHHMLEVLWPGPAIVLRYEKAESP